jgi:hypothetical protein
VPTSSSPSSSLLLTFIPFIPFLATVRAQSWPTTFGNTSYSLAIDSHRSAASYIVPTITVDKL